MSRAMPALEYSVNPYLVSSDRNVASGREPAAQRAGKPDLLRFTGSVNHRWKPAAGASAVARRGIFHFKQNSAAIGDHPH